MKTEYDFSAAAETARDKVQQALDSARQRTDNVVACSEKCVRERPALTLLAAFGVGIAAGAVVALVMRPAPPRPSLTVKKEEIRDRLADLLGTLATNLRGPVDRTCSSLGDGAAILSDAVTRTLKKFGR
ncbi:MAG: hypothetical protein PHC88_11100 [Terrimicrobiaceae bacterium]|nr:hypothetical protein [Terrimicrobiaceae bacterium]